MRKELCVGDFVVIGMHQQPLQRRCALDASKSPLSVVWAARRCAIQAPHLEILAARQTQNPDDRSTTQSFNPTQSITPAELGRLDPKSEDAADDLFCTFSTLRREEGSVDQLITLLHGGTVRHMKW